MFGVYDFALTGEKAAGFPFTMSAGIRNSIDKTLSAAVCVGSRVFVCDNLAFSGEKILTKKHTGTIEDLLPGLVREALVEFHKDFWERDVKLLTHWQEEEISVAHATDFIARVALGGSIPKSQILELRRNFIYPSHPEFNRNTVWALFNSFTQYAKTRDINPFDATEYSIRQFNAFKHEWPAKQEDLAIAT